MRKTKDEILQDLKVAFGDELDDAKIALLENVADTLEPSAEIEELTQRLEAAEAEKREIEATWKKKYVDRFFQPVEGTATEDAVVEQPQEDKNDVTFDDIFKEV